MFYLVTLLLLWTQALLMEVTDSTGLLFRLWLLPVVALSFRTNQLRLLPVFIIGLLADGLMATPTGLHVLEVSLIYGVLRALGKQLSNQTILTRSLIGGLVTLTDIFVMTLIEWILPYQVGSNILREQFFELLTYQVLLIVCVLPILSSLQNVHRRSDFRFRNEVDRS